MTEVICDYFGMSVARGDGPELMERLAPVIEAAGGGSAPSGNLYRFLNGGTVRHYSRGQVYVVGTSGAALAQFRQLGLFDTYLWGIVEGPPHKITQVHAALDIIEPAPPVVRRLFERSVKGAVKLTQKPVVASDVKKYFGVDSDGEETGTVYLGNRTRAVWAKVYDKRHERICAGFPDPGPRLRIEVSIGRKVGLSLRDVSEPAPVFYHFASPSLVVAPAGVSHWVPGGHALKLPPREQLLPSQRLMRLVESSPDIRRALQLAEQIGPHGIDYLYRKFDQMRLQRPWATSDSPLAPEDGSVAR